MSGDSFFFPGYTPTHPGGSISSSDLNAAFAELQRLSGMTVAPPLMMEYGASGMHLWLQNQPPIIRSYTFSGDENDHGLEGADIHYFDASANVTITGFVNPNMPRLILVVNVDATNTLTFEHEGTNSSALNRFDNPSAHDHIIHPGQHCFFGWDTNASRWRVMGPMFFGQCTDGFVPYFNSTHFEDSTIHHDTGVAYTGFNSGSAYSVQHIAPPTPGGVWDIGGPITGGAQMRFVFFPNSADAGDVFHVLDSSGNAFMSVDSNQRTNMTGDLVFGGLAGHADTNRTAVFRLVGTTSPPTSGLPDYLLINHTGEDENGDDRTIGIQIDTTNNVADLIPDAGVHPQAPVAFAVDGTKGATGTAGQWVITGGLVTTIGDGGISSGTAGSVVFLDGSGNLTQDNSNFFWDDTNDELGIGTNSPAGNLHVTSNVTTHIISIFEGAASHTGLLTSWRVNGTEFGNVAADGTAHFTNMTFDAGNYLAGDYGGVDGDVSGYDDALILMSAGTATALQYNTSANNAPTVNDDVTLGYVVGSIWCDVTNDDAYICLDNTDTAAVWKKITP